MSGVETWPSSVPDFFLSFLTCPSALQVLSTNLKKVSHHSAPENFAGLCIRRLEKKKGSFYTTGHILDFVREAGGGESHQEVLSTEGARTTLLDPN